MNIVTGSLGLYTDGFNPSRIPPCGATLTVLLAVGADAVPVGTLEEDATVAMLERRAGSCRDGKQRFSTTGKL